MKIVLIALGLILFALGVVGIMLPVLPTTPFLLLSATLFMHSSPRLYDWLLNHKYFGRYIRNYRENKIIPLRIKILSLSMLWATILCSIFAMGSDRIYVPVILLVVAIGVSWHILSHRSTVKEDNK
ncbi:MAG: YbaN family protein [Rikenellaceae bacterium]